jgi:hypothetical protein
MSAPAFNLACPSRAHRRVSRCGSWRIAAALCLLLVGGAGAPAQTPEAQTLPPIQVEAERRSVAKRVRTFVTAITPRDFADSLARWNHAICPVIVGPSEDQSDMILARLSAISSAAGVPLAKKPCKANLYIVENPAPEQLLQVWRKRDRLLFGDAALVTIDRFLNTPRAVRVWYNTSPGGPQDIAAAGASATAATGSAIDAAANAAALEFSEVLHFTSVIIVVDSKRLKGVALGQLADYVAMVGLAKIDPEANVGGAPSILRTFAASAGNSEEPVPASMTAWDQGFLRGLYVTRQSSRLQRSAIEDVMVNELVH